MKVKLTCPCGESFNVNSENFKNKTSIVCQNCSTEFPKEYFEQFKDAIRTLGKLENNFKYKTDDNGFEIPYWKFEL
ncbi:hypothetical protein OSC52_15440 [Clostridium pasteurianum]|uniref:hypothetical protein n=1 Tax=Clostridium pasteurianum TaxID=1501 RepID=UPI0022608127|nr:hypothetical protein [Clostridium pasteurianum]UZW13230.1 hypothetical protein OSC52_15440 [Clostridium pasteurianum]